MARYLTREEQAKMKAGIPLRLPNEKPRKQKCVVLQERKTSEEYISYLYHVEEKQDKRAKRCILLILQEQRQSYDRYLKENPEKRKKGKMFISVSMGGHNKRY